MCIRDSDRSLVSMQGLGYKEILAYLDGEITLEEAVYILKRDTRHFAKRQLTWFKREREVDVYKRQVYGYGTDRFCPLLCRKQPPILNCETLMFQDLVF